MVRWLRHLALLLLILLLAFAAIAWWLLRGSLPRLDGELALAGLSAPVSVTRDALGIATIEAANETDMARALGYLHAQERFFEMDLMRRTSAGELAELFGPIAVELDKQHRVHRMRARVMANFDAFTGDKRTQLWAYTEGVNAGLDALVTRPWPYLLLRQRPRRWEVADSALVGYAMYFDLQDSENKRELSMLNIRPHLPPALFALLAHDGSEWDAPLFGEAQGNAKLPLAAEVDLRQLPVADDVIHEKLTEPLAPGSNNWAIGGALTADGRAIVADDMHLGLRAPNIWFRARLRYADARAPGGIVDVSGFTLPGLPAVVVGSNGHVAWGFTNGYVDNIDFGVLCPEPHDFCLKDQPAMTAESVERILVRGTAPVDLKVRETDPMRAPGPHFPAPITHRLPDGTWLATVWMAHREGAIAMDLGRLATAQSIDDVLQIPLRGLPAQNLVIADERGRIAWMLAGNVPEHEPDCDPYAFYSFVRSPIIPQPKKAGAKPAHDASMMPAESPQAASYPPRRAIRDYDGCSSGFMDAAEAPRLSDPQSSRLWTANARTLGGQPLQRVGNGGYALGARAKQIRDGLFAKDKFTEQDLLTIQLDDRALFLERWWKLLQSERGNGKALRELAAASGRWPGRASTDSEAYRIVRAWRLAVNARIADGLTAPAQAALKDDFEMPDLPQLEGVAWPLLQKRPMHLLSRRFASWNALLEDAAKEVRDDLSQHGPLAQRRWGERNAAKICHPLASALPGPLKPLLCMPADELPGDSAMPRVQGPSFGASERMVVSPGHEADGIIHMPGGQSGHFLSPYWGAGHDDWVHGRPAPFLPGKTEHTLRLTP